MSFSLVRAKELQGRGAALAGIEGLQCGDEITLVYHFLVGGKSERLECKPGGEGVCLSLIQLWGHADYLERELHARYGVKFVGNPNLEKPK